MGVNRASQSAYRALVKVPLDARTIEDIR
ncbi:MAG: hypothetical protein V7642_3167, partial [Burkholderiales bacterium]